MSKIIICYRPADPQAITNRIYDHLCNTFGDAAVILGAKALLRAGDDYMVAIPNQIQAAQALVVVIGKNWADGNWLQDDADMDRIAIAAALNSQVRVVPVLVNGALPASRDLPSDLESLARRVGLTMSDATFRQDAPKLVDSVMPSASPPPIPQSPLQQPIPQPPAPVGRVQPQAPPPSPIYGQPPPPAPQPRTGQAGLPTQTFSLDPEMVRLIVTGFAAVAGALMIIATLAFSLVSIDNVGSVTPLDIFENAPRTIDYILLLIPLGGVALIAVAGAVFARRLKTDHGLLSIAGIAAILFCVPFMWRFLNDRDYESELENAGYSPEVVNRLLNNVSNLYSLAEFIWIPVGVFAIAMGGWWFLRTQPQLRLAAHPQMSGIPGQAQHPNLSGQQPQQQPAGGGFGHPTQNVVTIPTHYKIAGLGRRFMAFAIDAITIGIVLFILVSIYLFAAGTFADTFTSGNDWAETEGLIMRFLLIWLLSAPYQLYFLSRSGQTPGMEIVNLCVVRKDGSPLSIGNVIQRVLVGHTISTLIAFLGYFWAVFDSENRTWHDHLANTIVIEPSDAFWEMQESPPTPPRY